MTHEDRTLRRRGALALAVGGVCAVVVAFAVLAAIPPAAVDMPQEARVTVRAIMPEGWSFFTRNPREDRLASWRPAASGGWEDASLGNNAGPRVLFGASRRGRAQSVEIGLLQGAAMKRGAKWSACGWDGVDACLSRAAAATAVRNPVPEPTLCGTLAISLQEPTPWAWAGDGGRARMPYKVMRLEVTC